MGGREKADSYQAGVRVRLENSGPQKIYEDWPIFCAQIGQRGGCAKTVRVLNFLESTIAQSSEATHFCSGE